MNAPLPGSAKKFCAGFSCLLLVFCFCIFSQRSQAQQYNFENLSVGDGLAQSQVYALLEDSRGMLWMGTRGGGLSRYDGQRFISFTEQEGLVNNYIRCLLEDQKGNLWIGTDEGVSVYDGKSFTTPALLDSARSVSAMMIDAQKRFWIALEDSGLFCIRDNKIVARYLRRDTPAMARVTCLFAHPDGSTWAGTESGLVIIDAQLNISRRYTVREGLPANSLRAILPDKKNNIWIATYGGGLARYTSNQFRKYTVKDGLPNNTVNCLALDQKNNLWIGTAFGACKLENDSFRIYTENEGLCNNVVMSLLCDSWGNTWFGSSGGGVSRLDGERFIHFNEIEGVLGSSIYAVHRDRNGLLWMASSLGGVSTYDGRNYNRLSEIDGFTASKVRCIYEDTSGGFWFGTVSNGAWYYDGHAFTHFQIRDGLSSSFVNAITEDHSGRIWMATSGGGISIYDRSTEKFMRVGAKSGLTATRILSLYCDTSGKIWAGSQGQGVFVLETDTGGNVKLLRHDLLGNGTAANTVRAICSDLHENIWFGSAGGGISRWNKTGWKHFAIHEGLSSGNIYSLITDKSGQVWAGSEKGLDCILFKSGGDIQRVRHYGRSEGLRGIEASQNAFCADTNGCLWFGTINGLSRYNPEADFIDTIPPRLHITGIRLFFEPIQNTPFGRQINAWYPVPDSLVLPYEQNHLRFEFNGISLRNPEGVRYTWILEEFDQKWSPETSEQQAVYSNLPPGNYTFRIKARNADGTWSAVQLFRFSITPPIWATWWFRTLIALAVILLVFVIFQLRVRQLKRRNRERLVKLELEKNLLEIEQKALRLQMNPHFIFNALNSIQGYITRNDSVQAKRYLARFAKLMRLILENSRQQHTSIAMEAELLINYLELEKLCSGNRFDFEVLVDDDIIPDAVFIPVMLIQPFVENAALHGVRHLPSGGKITVRFSRHEKCIRCTIEDNGVGRAAAAEYEKGIVKDHESAALHITEERLRQSGEGAGSGTLEIIDLFDETGKASGTRVELNICSVIDESEA